MSPLLPNKTYNDINKALADIAEQRMIIDKCENCGVECQEFRDQLDAWETSLKSFKLEFFPDKP